MIFVSFIFTLLTDKLIRGVKPNAIDNVGNHLRCSVTEKSVPRSMLMFVNPDQIYPITGSTKRTRLPVVIAGVFNA